MTYRGHVEGGKVVLEGACDLPDGTEVEVQLAVRAETTGAPESCQDGGTDLPPTLRERLKDVVGTAKGLPPDAAMNHDHYLYGLPKREE